MSTRTRPKTKRHNGKAKQHLLAAGAIALASLPHDNPNPMPPKHIGAATVEMVGGRVKVTIHD